MEIKLHKQHQSIQKSHWWFRVKDNILRDVAQKYFKKGCTILDYGCNFGHITKLLQNEGYDTCGIDISEEAIKYGREHNIKNIYLDTEKILFPESFDVIVSLDVLEHINNHEKTFRYFYSLLRPGGFIVVMVPAFMFLWGVQDEISQHFRRYTLSEIIKVSEQAGEFEIIKKSYFNTILFLPISLIRLGSRFLKFKSRYSDLSINNTLLNDLFYAIFDFERKILKYCNFPFGVSILLVIKKKTLNNL